MISGTAGVGKTTLAVHWAHRVRERFPDGQLYADLRGHATGEPENPTRVLERFVRALGVPDASVPTDSQEKAALFRSLVADRRMLIVLDDAADPRQVRPLLPGSESCVVVVTSRNRLSGLVGREGAAHLTLHVLPEAEAVEVLRTTMRDSRAGDDQQQLTELAEACARLPLALRIAGQRAACRPLTPLGELLAALRDASSR